ncbi:MAG: HDOD domain-containing protein [Myxococcota bacterium]
MIAASTPGPEATERAKAVLSPAIAAEIDGQKLSLPMLPEAAFEALQLMSSPDPDLRTLSNLVHKDAALAASLIRAANSPAYYAGRKIVSIQQALVRLGAKTVGEIVLAATLDGKNNRVTGFENELRALHEHGVTVAVLSQELTRLRRGNAEEAFLAGLVHDLGRNVLLDALQKLCNKQRLPVDRAAVRSLADEHHERVGALLGSSWSLPDRVVLAMGSHHHPGKIEGGSDLGHVVALADSLAHRFNEREGPDLEHPSLTELHLYAEDVAKLFADRDRLDKRIGAFR